MVNPTEATEIVHWPGKDTAACPRHAEALKKLAAFLGFSVSVTPWPAGGHCANCENEKKNEGVKP